MDEHPPVLLVLPDALFETLRLAFVLVRLNDPFGGTSLEILRVTEPLTEQDLRDALGRSLGNSPFEWPSDARVSVENIDLHVASARLGVGGEMGFVTTGSERGDFPNQTERLLLDVTTNQAVVGLQHALVLSEQRRVASKLEEHLTQEHATSQRLTKS